MPNLEKLMVNCIIRNISKDDTPAYEAFIPAFNNIVFGDNVQEIEEGVAFSIETEIKERTQKNLPIPEPDVKSKFSGTFVIRINPALHEQIAMKAKVLGRSLNKYIEQQLAHA